MNFVRFVSDLRSSTRFTWVVASACLPSLYGCEDLSDPIPYSSDYDGGEKFRYAEVGNDDHKDMTTSELDFLDEDVVDRIGEENEDTDDSPTKLQSRYHADNCRLEETFANIESHFEVAVNAANPDAPDLTVSEKNFGRLLHPVQDFYAHSNWVESGQTELVQADDFRWPTAKPGERIGSMVVLSNTLPSSWSVTRASGSRVPVVDQGAGGVWQGLMSGIYDDNDDDSICPGGSIGIEHGSFLNTSLATYDGYLSKDAPLSAHHESAATMAKRQTVEEFCSFVRRVTVRYGERGRQLILDAWVDDVGAFRAACPNNDGLVAALFMASIGMP